MKLFLGNSMITFQFRSREGQIQFQCKLQLAPQWNQPVKKQFGQKPLSEKGKRVFSLGKQGLKAPNLM